MRMLNKYFLLFALTAMIAASCASEPAGMFRGNPARTGEYDNSGPRTLSRLAWRFQSSGEKSGSPAISGGTVYIVAWDGTFYSLDAKTGEENWSYEVGADVFSSPAINEGVLFFVDLGGYLHAINVETRREIWSYDAGDMVFAIPAIFEETAFFHQHGRCFSLPEHCHRRCELAA